jgi:hypothetical protein
MRELGSQDLLRARGEIGSSVQHPGERESSPPFRLAALDVIAHQVEHPPYLSLGQIIDQVVQLIAHRAHIIEV